MSEFVSTFIIGDVVFWAEAVIVGVLASLVGYKYGRIAKSSQEYEPEEGVGG